MSFDNYKNLILFILKTYADDVIIKQLKVFLIILINTLVCIL